MPKNQVFFAYIPVFHQGWASFLNCENRGEKKPRNRGEKKPRKLVLLDGQYLRPWAPTHKDLHAFSANKMALMLQAFYPDWQIEVADADSLLALNNKNCELIIPDDTALINYIEQNLPLAKICPQNIWLRWEKEKISSASATPTPASATPTPAPAQLVPQQILNFSDLPKKIQNLVSLLKTEGQKSGDWWRQVGAIAVRNGQILLQTHNTHLPHSDQPYREGDMRAQFHRGDHLEASTAIHAEALLVATAAKTGLMLDGADLYLTDFPCPTCSKLIASAGFRHLFYLRGYSVLDGQRVLDASGVKITQLKLD